MKICSICSRLTQGWGRYRGICRDCQQTTCVHRIACDFRITANVWRCSSCGLTGPWADGWTALASTAPCVACTRTRVYEVLCPKCDRVREERRIAALSKDANPADFLSEEKLCVR